MVTKKGVMWELINSLWIIFSLFGLSFVSFFYIGSKARTFKWKAAGVAYLFANIVSIVIAAIAGLPGILQGVLCAIWFASLFVGPVHAFLVRKEYLIRREYILNTGLEEKDLDKIREEVHYKYSGKKKNDVNSIEKNQDDYSTMIYNNDNDDKIAEYYDENITKGNEDILDNSKYVSYHNKNNKGLININTSDRDELLKLPGMNDELVDKAISLREMLKGFNSVDEFIEMLHIELRYSSEILSKATVGDRKIIK